MPRRSMAPALLADQRGPDEPLERQRRVVRMKQGERAERRGARPHLKAAAGS
jgi:hypothetical protein